MSEEWQKVKELESEKDGLIGRYMTLQDEADSLNERIYNVCCSIEGLNLQIEKARREAEEADRKRGKPVNGKTR